MKKIRLVIPVIAIVTGVFSALASSSKQACTMEPQYYYSGGRYFSAGVLGKDYICLSGGGTCTYIGAGNFFQPCQSGIYSSLHVRALKK
ncbi:MAG: hypothetical protein J0H07_33045 [Sphingobacteriales bacterium]|nr:hypothetical protein [Sphingobacteriales bacterium]